MTRRRHATGSSLTTTSLEIPLPPVCGRLSEGPRLPEVDRSGFLEGGCSASATVIEVDELQAVRQFARNDRRMTAELRGVQLIRYHDINDARASVEILDDPQCSN
jgi:hypothetical protein